MVFQISEEQKADAERQIVEASKRIEFFTVDYSVELLVQKLKAEEFFIPEYQREFVWELKRRRRFIESLIIGLPVPFLFFWENRETGALEVVDGSQRLRTLREFLEDRLILDNLEKLDLLKKFKFSDLPQSRRRKIKNRPIRAIILSEHADEESRFDMFDRVNTGSKSANTSEIRRGALIGPFQSLINRLALDSVFAGLTPMSESKVKGREREELVTRFFAYGDGLEGYRDMVSSFCFAYVKKMNGKLGENPDLSESYERRFHQTMDFVAKTFPWGFRRVAEGKSSPRSRFEAIALGSFHAIKDEPKILEEQIMVPWHNSDEFTEITGADGANAIRRLKGRIEYVRDKLMESYDDRL